jgi:hypothetical protein
VPRRGLAAGEAEQIVRAEIAEREAAAAGYEGAGHGEQARRLRQEARILAAVLDAGARLSRLSAQPPVTHNDGR